MAAIDVIIVDDSVLCRDRLREIVEEDGGARVVAALSSGEEALSALRRLRPQALITDLLMPGVDGLAVIEEVMRQMPIPILVVSGSGASAEAAFEATRLGALSLVEKPALGDRRAEEDLRRTLREIAAVPVVRHPGRTRASAPPARVVDPPSFRGPAPIALGVGASAGGPPAILSLLDAMRPEDAPAVLIAQHMPADHAATFAQYLRARCPLDVVLCRGVTAIRPGVVVVPDDGRDLVALDRERVASVPASSPLTPSADALLASLAAKLGAEAAGAVLSGIGDDGARGLAALRDAGGLALAQDAASAAVYGMPRAAAAAAHFQLPPGDIGRLVCAAVARRPPGRR